MNNNIQKLYDKSFVRDDYVNVGPDGHNMVFRFDPDKFAHLIVQECIARCEKIGFEWHAIDTPRASGAKAGAFECAQELKKHFGVQ